MGTSEKKCNWLIGQASEFLPVGLPTFGDVFRTYFYKRFVDSKQKGPSYIEVAKQLVAHWKNLEKTTVAPKDVVRRFKKLDEMYDLLKKGKPRRTPKQLNQEDNFVRLLNKVFDIAPKLNYHHNKQQNSVQIEDLAESMHTEAINRHYHHPKQQNSVQIENLDEETQAMEVDNISKVDRRNKVLNLVAAESDAMEVDNENDKDFEAKLSVYYKLQFSIDEPDKKTDDAICKIINSPDVSSALDRTNTSTSSFVIILAAISRALEVDLTECVFSTSTLLRRRSDHREVIKEVVKNEFLASIKSGLVVHWDGKRLKDTTNEEHDERNRKVERIAIVVTGLDTQKILAIARSDDGTGVVVSDTVYEHLEAWTILETIIAMCTDTTGANTGCTNGACVLLEQMMGRNLVYFACRHHMFELIIGAVFIKLFGETTGPNIEMFENFKRDWCEINKASFKVQLKLVSS